MRRWATLQAHFRRRRHAHVLALKRGRRMTQLLAARKLQCRWAIKHGNLSTYLLIIALRVSHGYDVSTWRAGRFAHRYAAAKVVQKYIRGKVTRRDPANPIRVWKRARFFKARLIQRAYRFWLVREKARRAIAKKRFRAACAIQRAERCHLLRTRRPRKNAAAKAFQYAWWRLRPLKPVPSAEDEGWRVRRAAREAEGRRRRYEAALAAKKEAVARAKAAKAAAAAGDPAEAAAQRLEASNKAKAKAAKAAKQQKQQQGSTKGKKKKGAKQRRRSSRSPSPSPSPRHAAPLPGRSPAATGGAGPVDFGLKRMGAKRKFRAHFKMLESEGWRHPKGSPTRLMHRLRRRKVLRDLSHAAAAAAVVRLAAKRVQRVWRARRALGVLRARARIVRCWRRYDALRCFISFSKLRGGPVEMLRKTLFSARTRCLQCTATARVLISCMSALRRFT